MYCVSIYTLQYINFFAYLKNRFYFFKQLGKKSLKILQNEIITLISSWGIRFRRTAICKILQNYQRTTQVLIVSAIKTRAEIFLNCFAQPDENQNFILHKYLQNLNDLNI